MTLNHKSNIPSSFTIFVITSVLLAKHQMVVSSSNRIMKQFTTSGTHSNKLTWKMPV